VIPFVLFFTNSINQTLSTTTHHNSSTQNVSIQAAAKRRGFLSQTHVERQSISLAYQVTILPNSPHYLKEQRIDIHVKFNLEKRRGQKK